MKKKIAVLLLLSLAVLPVFAATKSDVSVGAGVQMISVGDKFGIGRISLEGSETAYFEKEGKSNSPLFRFNAGVSMNIQEDGKPLFGLSLSALGGYSFKLNDLLRLDVSGGIDFFESSALIWIFNALSKDSEYKITTSFAPIADASVLFGLENISVRAGFRGFFQIGNASIGKGIGVMPYVALSSQILDILSLF